MDRTHDVVDRVHAAGARVHGAFIKCCLWIRRSTTQVKNNRRGISDLIVALDPMMDGGD
jgi:hypothetical protein